MFTGSPIKRIGRDRFVRNVLIAAGNSGDSSLGNAVRALLGDASPLVRGAAVWALSRLVPETEFARRATAAVKAESDDAVQREWRLALANQIEAHA